MQFLTSLFGGSGATAISAVLALGIVLVLIVLLVWALKFVFKASTNVGRGRSPRLMLIDSMTIDPKRQLLIVRRDNVEHLILTGGPQDVVIESGIAVDPSLTRRTLPVVPAMSPEPAPPPNPFLAVAEPAGPHLPSGAIERLREFTRPLSHRSPSLRHTGLMRATGGVEVIPGYLDDAAHDSAKTTPVVEAKIGDAFFSRDGITASGK